MLDKYMAYLSSLTIHSEQMKASSQLEGVCGSPVPSLPPCRSEVGMDGETSACWLW